PCPAASGNRPRALRRAGRSYGACEQQPAGRAPARSSSRGGGGMIGRGVATPVEVGEQAVAALALGEELGVAFAQPAALGTPLGQRGQTLVVRGVLGQA